MCWMFLSLDLEGTDQQQYSMQISITFGVYTDPAQYLLIMTATSKKHRKFAIYVVKKHSKWFRFHKIQSDSQPHDLCSLLTNFTVRLLQMF